MQHLHDESKTDSLTLPLGWRTVALAVATIALSLALSIAVVDFLTPLLA